MLLTMFESDTKPLLLFLLRERHKQAYTRTGWTLQITAQSSNGILAAILLEASPTWSQLLG